MPFSRALGLPTALLRGHTRDAITRRGASFLAAALALGATGILALPSAAFAWDANTFNSASEQQLVSLTNQARAAAGVSTLRVDSALTALARSRSQDMEQRGYFSHNIPPSGTMVWDLMDEQGYCYNLAGENIGWDNYPDDEATAQIEQMFLASPEHHDNIMGRAWDVIGVGAYKGDDGHMMWTVLFVDKFGCGGSTPAATPKPTPRPTPSPTPTLRRTVTPRTTQEPSPEATVQATARPEPVRPVILPTPTPREPSNVSVDIYVTFDDSDSTPTLAQGVGLPAAQELRLTVVTQAGNPGLIGSVVFTMTRLLGL